MGKDTKIEWCQHTLNLWWGCQKVHAGCDNCYAERFSNRWGKVIWGGPNRLQTQTAFKFLTQIEKLASAEPDIIQTVFVGSMMDIFEKDLPLVDTSGEFKSTGQIRAEFFNRVDQSPKNVVFLLLTKRPSNINKIIPEHWKSNPPSNVWFGISASDQSTLDNLLVKLAIVKGNKFLSLEPQIDSVVLPINSNEYLHWVIQGGESGPNKRPFATEWATELRYQCENQSIPYFFKQIDKVQQPAPEILIRQFPNFRQ